MEWSTIPLELLERILIFTKSPKAVANTLIACKTWSEVDQDQHLWQHLYYIISGNRITDVTTVDLKKKVVDFVLVGQNVKDGRCVVRTLATTQGVRTRVTLDIENPSIYEDYFLCGWLESQNYGSYGGTNRIGSHLIDMVKEEAKSWKCQKTFFMNHYVAETPSNYYGGSVLTEVKVQEFDPQRDPVLTPSNSVKFNMRSESRILLQNWDSNSNYIGFSSPSQVGGSVVVVNAETGKIVYSFEGTTLRAGHREIQLFDTYLAIPKTHVSLEIIDVQTGKCIAQRSIQEKYHLGFMTENTIIIRTEQIIIKWNFIDGTDVVYPADEVPMSNIEMIYHDMWVVPYHEGGKLSFYNIHDGSRINTLALRKGYKTDRVSLLSDGRICVARQTGCQVISFFSSEVNRQIQVDVMDVDGTVKSHEISAHELPNFFVKTVGKPLEMMISRVISYPQKSTHQSNERFVLICTQDEKSKTLPENTTATKLLKTEVKPTCVNTPYQAWAFDNQPIVMRDFILDRVCGKAIIVRETRVKGRWQLASMN